MYKSMKITGVIALTLALNACGGSGSGGGGGAADNPQRMLKLERLSNPAILVSLQKADLPVHGGGQEHPHISLFMSQHLLKATNLSKTMLPKHIIQSLKLMPG